MKKICLTLTFVVSYLFFAPGNSINAAEEVPELLNPNTGPIDPLEESFSALEPKSKNSDVVVPLAPPADEKNKETIEEATKKTSEEECETNEDGAVTEYCLNLDTFRKENEVVHGKNGIELMQNLIQKLYIAGASIIGLIAVLIIVVSGIQISFGGAHQESVNIAKTRIMQALFSLILLFSSALILKTINPAFFVTETPTQNETEK